MKRDSFGPCCACEEIIDTVRNIGFLDRRCAVPGHGWGCVVCELPLDGALIVLCDRCATAEDKPRFACRGRPNADGREPIEETMARPKFQHDLRFHPEMGTKVSPRPLTEADAIGRREAGEKFIIVKKECATGIQCLKCLMVSWNPNDVSNLYCAHCHVFHSEGGSRCEAQ
jgi:hypothetical protein